MRKSFYLILATIMTWSFATSVTTAWQDSAVEESKPAEKTADNSADDKSDEKKKDDKKKRVDARLGASAGIKFELEKSWASMLYLLCSNLYSVLLVYNEVLFYCRS